MGRKLVAFDFDSTIIDGETLMEIAKLNGSDKKAEEYLKKSLKNSADYGESIRIRVEMLKGIKVSDITKLIEKIPLTKGAEETLRELRRRGHVLILITGNFTVCTEKVAHFFDEIYANEFEVENGVLTGRIKKFVVNSAQKKAEILVQCARKYGIPLSDTIAVGDSASDIEMFAVANKSICFNCKIPQHDKGVKDLREVLKYA
ncbi:MAG: phosphoserine phosphatase SerB [Candidatus Micrarchaeia archaeon]